MYSLLIIDKCILNRIEPGIYYINIKSDKIYEIDTDGYLKHIVFNAKNITIHIKYDVVYFGELEIMSADNIFVKGNKLRYKVSFDDGRMITCRKI